MTSYKEVVAELDVICNKLEHVEVEYHGETHTVDLSPPFSYCHALCKGLIAGCLEKTEGENVESVGMVAGGLVGILIEGGDRELKKSNQNPGGYA
jgi:hypothetical protein